MLYFVGFLDYWFEELHGLVDAINHPNVTFESTMHVMLLGELTRGTCSMFGAWGDAVQNAGTKLLQLRALDWDNEGNNTNLLRVSFGIIAFY